MAAQNANNKFTVDKATMQSMQTLRYIKKLLPDIETVNGSSLHATVYSNIPLENKTVQILLMYFNRKKLQQINISYPTSIPTDAHYINRLFPTLNMVYILEQLAIFADMPNRTEIVLRLILHSITSKNTQVNSEFLKLKRTISNNQAEDYPEVIKIRKIARSPEIPISLDQHNSKIVTPAASNSDFVSVPFVISNADTVRNENVLNVQKIPENAIPNKPHTDVSSIQNVPLLTENDYAVIDSLPGSSKIEEQLSDFPVLDAESVANNNLQTFDGTQSVSCITSHQDLNNLLPPLVSEPQNGELELNGDVNMTQIKPYEDVISDFMKSMDTYNCSPSTSKQNAPIGWKTSQSSFDAPLSLLLNSGSPSIQKINEKWPVSSVDLTSPAYVNNYRCDFFKSNTLDLTSDSSVSIPYTDVFGQEATLGDNNIKQPNIFDDIPDDDAMGASINQGFTSSDIVLGLRFADLELPRKPRTYRRSDTVIDEGSNSADLNRIEVDLAVDLTVPDVPQNIILDNVHAQVVSYLCGIFPEACPQYIRKLCMGKPNTDAIVDELTTVILNMDGQYPKRIQIAPETEVYPENQFDILKEFLPDADPDYLRMMCDSFEGKVDKAKAFINEAMERRNYPTLKDYQRRQQLSAQQKQYTTEFSVENFVKVIPDPKSFFSDASRTVKMDRLCAHYALVFLRNTFNRLPIRTIQSCFTKSGCNLRITVEQLREIVVDKSYLMKSVRRPIELPNNLQNIPLLQEIAYITHEQEIADYLKQIEEKEENERKEALSNGLMKTCSCCYDEEVLPKNIFCCASGCQFCKSCITKSTEVRFGEGKLDFPCLMDCSSDFSLQTLQAVLSPKLFSKIAQKKALEEIKSAGIEEMETCPFCDFATIPAEGYTIFTCLNPECMKESCRMCKQPSHIPLRCDEIEKDEDVQARTFVENKMTEALLKKCWKCGIKFFKEEGCNKMTCSCGAKMCYVCGQPVTDYKHFNGNGGDRYHLCPLYSDSHGLNKDNVLRGAEEAKAEIGNKNLKHDPTKDIEQHYKERAQKGPQPNAMPFQHALPPEVRNIIVHQRHHHRRHRRHQNWPF